VPFPDKLNDTEWSIKWAQVKFLAETGVLGSSMKKMLE